MAASRHEDEIDREIDDVAALADPVRRRLYRYVADSADAVSREQAAADVGVAHHVAKFHLDRLEADGLLDTEFRRPAGRSVTGDRCWRARSGRGDGDGRDGCRRGNTLPWWPRS